MVFEGRLTSVALSQESGETATNRRFDKLLIKTNALVDVLTVANIGAEININDRFSIDLPVYYSPYNIGKRTRIRVFIIQPEVKYWLNHTPFSGHYLGVNFNTGWYNYALNKNKRYQDNKMLIGAGVTYGYYHQPVNSKFLLGAHLGLGYNYFSYDVFNYGPDCKRKIGMETKNYWGLTQIGITVAYKINLK